MKRVMIIFAALIGAMSTFAADENDQLLVFRNTGEVNLFYASEVDSIVCSYMDADSIVYDVLVSQVFYAKDTTLYVPIEEIDSVTYGCRNAVEYKKDAMAIDATHLEWIESYDGTYIHYKAHTPANIIPKEGTGLFFPAQESDIFPNGLCAKVEQVNGTIVCVRKAEFDEVFDELFWAGELEVEIPSATRAEFETYVSLNKKMKLGNGLSFNMSGGTSIVATFVVQPRRHYYHGKIELKGANVTYSAALNMTDVAPYEVQEEIVDIVGAVVVSHHAVREYISQRDAVNSANQLYKNGTDGQNGRAAKKRTFLFRTGQWSHAFLFHFPNTNGRAYSATSYLMRSRSSVRYSPSLYMTLPRAIFMVTSQPRLA